MVALRSGLEAKRGVRGNSIIEEAWVKPAADRREGRLRSKHGAAALGAGRSAEVRARGQARHKLAPFEGYLKERQDAPQPDTILATVLYREIAARS